MLQANTTAGDTSRHPREQGPQHLPASAESLALSLPANKTKSGEKKSGDDVGKCGAKVPGLRINTKAAEPAALATPREEPTPGERLYADYVESHNEFRRELDNLARERDAAKKRAETAELREKMVHRDNNVCTAKIKSMSDSCKSEREKVEQVCENLKVRSEALELSIGLKNQAIEGLKQELQRERQMSAIARSEHAKNALRH